MLQVIAAISTCSNMFAAIYVLQPLLYAQIFCMHLFFFDQCPNDLGRIQLPAFTKGRELVILSVLTQANWHSCHSSPDTCEYVCTTATNMIVFRTLAMKKRLAIPRQEVPFTHHRNRSPLWNVPNGVAISMAYLRMFVVCPPMHTV